MTPHPTEPEVDLVCNEASTLDQPMETTADIQIAVEIVAPQIDSLAESCHETVKLEQAIEGDEETSLC